MPTENAVFMHTHFMANVTIKRGSLLLDAVYLCFIWLRCVVHFLWSLWRRHRLFHESVQCINWYLYIQTVHSAFAPICQGMNLFVLISPGFFTTMRCHIFSPNIHVSPSKLMPLQEPLRWMLSSMQILHHVPQQEKNIALHPRRIFQVSASWRMILTKNPKQMLLWMQMIG